MFWTAAGEREVMRAMARLETWIAVWQMNRRELQRARVGDATDVLAWDALLSKQCPMTPEAQAASAAGH